MKDREEFLLQLALNLNRAVRNADRYEQLLAIFVRAFPCDAACLFLKQGNRLLPLSTYGLTGEIMFRHFEIAGHPRLSIISEAHDPIVFPHDCTLPDPFDGLMEKDFSASVDVHSCMGCPLIVEDEVLGILTADAMEANRFDQIDRELLKMVAALAAATLRTSLLIEQIEQSAYEQKLLGQNLLREANLPKEVTLIGASPAMENLLRIIEMVAPSDLSILITGETGTGKELVARKIHQNSRRSAKALIYVNCAALPESIAESELFGHKKGAFTGAAQDRMGKFELADGGTLFLDEIGELPLAIQPKLLRALQEGEIQRVGSDQLKSVDVRIIAATNRNLEKEIERGKFRSDLYHRLNAYPVHIPPLRQRTEDIEILTNYFCDVLQRKFGTTPVRIDDHAKELMKLAYWPGNVRELKNVLSRAILTAHYRRAESKVLLLTASDLDSVAKQEELASKNLQVPRLKSSHRPLREATQDFQRSYILQVLNQFQNNWSKTAKALGLHRSNLHHLAKRLGLLSSD